MMIDIENDLNMSLRMLLRSNGIPIFVVVEPVDVNYKTCVRRWVVQITKLLM